MRVLAKDCCPDCWPLSLLRHAGIALRLGRVAARHAGVLRGHAGHAAQRRTELVGRLRQCSEQNVGKTY